MKNYGNITGLVAEGNGMWDTTIDKRKSTIADYSFKIGKSRRANKRRMERGGKGNLETLKSHAPSHDVAENKEPGPEGEPKTNR